MSSPSPRVILKLPPDYDLAMAAISKLHPYVDMFALDMPHLVAGRHTDLITACIQVGKPAFLHLDLMSGADVVASVREIALRTQAAWVSLHGWVPWETVRAAKQMAQDCNDITGRPHRPRLQLAVTATSFEPGYAYAGPMPYSPSRPLNHDEADALMVAPWAVKDFRDYARKPPLICQLPPGFAPGKMGDVLGNVTYLLVELPDDTRGAQISYLQSLR